MVVKGFAAPETGDAYARARALWEQLGSRSELLHIPWGQSHYYAVRDELDQAQTLAEDLLQLSCQRDDSAGLALGHYSLGRTFMYMGSLARARSHELLRNVGDGRVQAASGCWLTASMPSMNFVPVISFGNWLWRSRRRQLFSAACASLKIMAIVVLFERHPLERIVRCRTVANVLQWGWWSAGASKAQQGSRRTPAAPR